MDGDLQQHKELKVSTNDQSNHHENEANGSGRKSSSGENDERTEVMFPKRKRVRREKRKRPSLIEEDERNAGNGDDEEKELSREELMLIKEAQQLREANRRTILDFRGLKGTDAKREKAKKGAEGASDDIIGGLASSFAVEKSGHAVEERMGKYIEERMKAKFGDRWGEDGGPAVGKRAEGEEQDLFAIPERLQLSQRPMYDPGEGLPAAGVEEVELPDEARQNNIRETVRAHKDLLTTKKQKRHKPDSDASVLPGNLSANFAKHRDDWIASNLGPKQSTFCHSQIEEAGEGDNRSHEKGKGTGSTAGVPRQRGFQVATDGAVADRFKKRWRK